MKSAARKGKPVGRRRWRRDLARWIALVVSAVLALAWVPWPQATSVLPGISPFIAIGALLAGASFSFALFGVAGIIAAVCTVRQRFVCRYLCPLGLLQDCAAKAAPRQLNVRKIPRIGHLLVAMTWVGAAFGFPLFLWLDPLSMFSAMLGNGRHAWLWVPPVVVIGLSVVLPRLWCMRLCPLGATQEILRWPAMWRRALRLRKAQGSAPAMLSAARFQLPRRALLASVGLLAAGGVGGVLGRRLCQAAQGSSPKRLRPPGAVEGEQFASLCIRCGNCLQACPSQILQPDWTSGRLADLAAPFVTFADDYCREDCHACTQVCPSGAISRLSLEEKLEHSIGMVKIEFDLCLLAYDRECEICKRVCPREAIAFAWSEKEYTVTPQLAAERCNGCGACVVACPGENTWEREADPQIAVRKAITIQPILPAEGV